MKVVAAEHVAAVAGAGALPPPGPPEVAFLGRSNVGKSSLLNALAGRRGLARTSSTPGKTRLLHFYRLECRQGAARRPIVLVDLPGYGWARVSQEERRGWRALVEGYLAGREPLRVAVLLQDLRRDVSEDELDLLAWLAEQRVPVLVALTKCDKLSQGPRAARVRELARALGASPERVLATSASRGLGVTELWRAILAHVA